MTKPRDIRLVAIGASAGGVAALGLVLQALPAHFAAPVAIVLHLPPDQPSRLAQLYAGRCALPLKEMEDKEFMRPGTVYFAAPDYHMLVEPDGSLSLSCEEPVNYSRPSIDLMLETAAQAYGPELLAIVLTGASSDGARGLAAVRRAGGLAWVQDPQEAQATAMPLAAIETAGADRIMPLAAMADALAALDTTIDTTTRS